MKRRVGVVVVALVAAVSVGTATASPPVLPPALWVKEGARGDERRLVRYTNFGMEAPEWSPDSRSIAYETGRIFVVDVATGDRRRVSDKEGFDGAPDWSPDGSEIAYARHEGSGGAGIRVVDVASREVRQITSGRDDAPDWSPDGSEILFSRTGNDRGVFVVDANTGDERKLFGDTADAAYWSPDGGSIAFIGSTDIFVVAADGTGAVNLTRTSKREYSFAWAPDGSRLAYVRGGNRLFLVNADATHRRRIELDIRRGLSDVAWTRSGRITVGSFSEVFTVRPDGTRLRRVAKGSSPAWSPDGSWLAFLRS